MPVVLPHFPFCGRQVNVRHCHDTDEFDGKLEAGMNAHPGWPMKDFVKREKWGMKVAAWDSPGLEWRAVPDEGDAQAPT